VYAKSVTLPPYQNIAKSWVAAHNRLPRILGGSARAKAGIDGGKEEIVRPYFWPAFLGSSS